MNPFPNSGILAGAGLAHFLAGDLERAIEAYEAARDANPEHLGNQIYLTAVLSRSGRQDDAEWQAMEVLTLNPVFSVERWTITQAYKDPAERDRLREDLLRAGLPE